MKTYKPDEEAAQLEFAQKAAKCFGDSPEIRTFTNSGDIEQGELFAVRWGLDADCVVVLKVDEYHEPTNYHNIVDNQKAKEHTRLIVAAPELLEMLKEAVERCEINNCDGEEKEFIEKFNATIAKAEGKEVLG